MRWRPAYVASGLFSLAVVTAAGIGLVVRPEEKAALHLDEISAHTLPDAFEISGTHVSRHGGAIYWAVNNPNLILDDGRQLRVIETDSLVRPVAAVLTEEDTVIEVIDGERKSVATLTLAGRFLRERPLQLPWTVEAAVYTASGWVLGGRDVAGNYRIIKMAPSGARNRLLTIPARAHKGVRLSMRLSSGERGVFATFVNSPHLVAHLGMASDDSSLITQSQFRVPALPGIGRREPPLWISLAVHQLDRGYIRTFSDLRSDQRVLATYDADGTLLRAANISVPLAVLATAPADRVLLAARRTDRLEVVRYKWRWAGAEHQPEESR